MDATTDARLIEDILGGDGARFGELVERFDGRVQRVVQARVADPLVREEVVQETWCHAYRHLARLSRPEKLGAWLGSIARRCVAEHRRTGGATASVDPEVAAPLRDAGWVWDEVAALTPDAAELLRFRYRDGLDYRALARRYRVPVSTIRGRLYVARRALRRRIDGDKET